MLGSLLYIGGRPVPFEQVAAGDGELEPAEDHAESVSATEEPTGTTPLPGGIETVAGTTLMPGDPAYDEFVEEAQEEEKGVPYLDEGTGQPTTGKHKGGQRDG